MSKKWLSLLVMGLVSHPLSYGKDDAAASKTIGVSQQVVSLSAVLGVSSQSQTITVTNPHGHEVASKPVISGKDTKVFKLGKFPDRLAAGASRELTVHFSPDSNIKSASRYTAAIQIGEQASGVLVSLHAIGLAKFEGKNEPVLNDITQAFGMTVNVGGDKLHLDTRKRVIGDGVEASYFRAVAGKKVVITPLARFSPKGEVNIGLFRKKAQDLEVLGRLSDVSPKHPDAHQCLLPPLVTGLKTIEFSPGGEAFGIYIQGKKYLVATDQARSKDSKVKHGTRVYPVRLFQGRLLENAYMIGFEEAANGDYQDGLILLENVTIE